MVYEVYDHGTWDDESATDPNWDGSTTDPNWDGSATDQDWDTTTDPNNGRRLYRAKHKKGAEKRRRQRLGGRRKMAEDTTTTADATDTWSNYCEDEEWARYCVDGYPDFDLICDNMWDLPENYYEGVSIPALCDATMQDACAQWPVACSQET